MKNLKSYIQEGLRINQSTKKNIRQYSYFPKDKKELSEIISKKLEENNDADLNDIDVSKIDDMSDLFHLIHYSPSIICNIDISYWDVSNVKNMNQMFYGCEKFDCDLSEWDVSNVEDMTDMFAYCKRFKGKGLENWDISSVKKMHQMFYGCKALKNYPSWYES